MSPKMKLAHHLFIFTDDSITVLPSTRIRNGWRPIAKPFVSKVALTTRWLKVSGNWDHFPSHRDRVMLNVDHGGKRIIHRLLRRHVWIQSYLIFHANC